MKLAKHTETRKSQNISGTCWKVNVFNFPPAGSGIEDWSESVDLMQAYVAMQTGTDIYVAQQTKRLVLLPSVEICKFVL